MYLVFACMPGESYCQQLLSLLLCLCDALWVLINSLVCWFSLVVQVTLCRHGNCPHNRKFPQQWNVTVGKRNAFKEQNREGGGGVKKRLTVAFSCLDTPATFSCLDTSIRFSCLDTPATFSCLSTPAAYSCSDPPAVFCCSDPPAGSTGRRHAEHPPSAAVGCRRRAVAAAGGTA